MMDKKKNILNENQEKLFYEKVEEEVLKENTWKGLRRMDEYDIQTQDEDDPNYNESNVSFEVNNIVNAVSVKCIDWLKTQNFDLTKEEYETLTNDVVDYIYQEMWNHK